MAGLPLYILRRPLGEIPPAALPPSNAVDVVFIERSRSDSSVIGEISHPTGSRRAVTYDDLVGKLFETDRAIVI